MKIFIMTDIEGAALVTKFTQTQPKPPDETPEKLTAKELLTGEVNAAVNGILDCDAAADIIIADGHGSGGLNPEKLHPRAKVLCGGFRPPWLLDKTFDGYFFVGQHAMAGTPTGVLAHTYSSKSIEYYKLNGVLAGEFACRAAMADTFGVPTVFVSGDAAAADEALALIPNIVTAVVKWGDGIESCLSLSAAAARELIRKKSAEACRLIPEIKPYVIKPPFELEIRKQEGQILPPPERLDQWHRDGLEVEIIDDRTYKLTAADICRLPI